MAITPVQTNIDTKKTVRPYIQADERVTTKNNVKPALPEGHLVHDRVQMMPKYFLKDIAYDLKAVRDGFIGTANDHQAGRFNDVGLRLSGVGIATYLASQTKNPVARIMEYAGLGAFLASMSIFPKLAIQAPSRAIHGFDTGIEYIDDQGRKKSMFQDSNYIPFDMYQGDNPNEDLDIIGDRLGVPRDIKNRHDVIKEQMRKVATQNNTLWMLTAGLATPVISALICNGAERIISPAVQNIRNKNYNSKISQMLDTTSQMSQNVREIQDSKFSQEIAKILKDYEGRELPKIEQDKIIEKLTKNLDENTSIGLREDLSKLLNDNIGEKVFNSSDIADIVIEDIRKNIPIQNRTRLEKVFIPTKDEIMNIIEKNNISSIDQIQNIKNELAKLYSTKIQGVSNKEYYQEMSNDIIDRLGKVIKKQENPILTKGKIEDITNLAKVLNEFKVNQQVLDKCRSFKVEYAPETVLARYYGKFEKAFMDALNFSMKDLKQMRESNEFTQEIFDKKLTSLVNDDKKYQKTLKKLAKIMEEMDATLDGKSNETSNMKDLISAIENNYNNTAKRLNNIGSDKFKNTISRLVQEDVNTLSNSISSKEEMFEVFDGIRKPKNLSGLEYVKDNAKGVGSSKNYEISRTIERYQGINNTFNRILHLLDTYKKGTPEGQYEKELFEKGKEVIISADSSKHTLKLNTVNNPEYYKDILRTFWSDNAGSNINDSIANNGVGNKTIKDRFASYIKRFRDIIGNNDIDFTKLNHYLNKEDLKQYEKSSKTRMAKFNLVAQNPVDFVKKSADRLYVSKKWLHIVSAIGIATIGATVLAQIGFGKLRNPQNVEKQVNDDTNE